MAGHGPGRLADVTGNVFPVSPAREAACTHLYRAQTDLAGFATKADIRWILAILELLSAFILAIAAKLFGIV